MIRNKAEDKYKEIFFDSVALLTEANICVLFPTTVKIFKVKQLEVQLGSKHLCLLLNKSVMAALGDLFSF